MLWKPWTRKLDKDEWKGRQKILVTKICPPHSRDECYGLLETWKAWKRHPHQQNCRETNLFGIETEESQWAWQRGGWRGAEDGLCSWFYSQTTNPKSKFRDNKRKFGCMRVWSFQWPVIDHGYGTWWYVQLKLNRQLARGSINPATLWISPMLMGSVELSLTLRNIWYSDALLMRIDKTTSHCIEVFVDLLVEIR